MRKYLLFFMILPVLALVSCEENEPEGEGKNTETTIDQDNKEEKATGFRSKWLISDPESPFESFEFTEDGNYIVVNKHNAQEAKIIKAKPVFVIADEETETNISNVHFGTYTIEGDKIILSGFGVLEIIEITAKEFSFSFTLEETGETFTYTANKTEVEIPASANADFLCRTWKIDYLSIDEDSISELDKYIYQQNYGEEWLEKYTEITIENINSDDVSMILFSKNGTYLVLYTDGSAGLSEWKWKNEEQTEFYYSWDNWQGDNWETSIVFIKELSDTKFEFSGYYDRDIIYHLVPME
jgi:hypothetical protein